ncbi:MAG: AAA family ATPase [Vicinamibacterales bacterium]
MRLELVTVKDMLRFSGAPVTLDLREVPAGLVAIIGPNGEGKTTILEAGMAAIFRAFPSRDGKDLFDYATSREAFIEALFVVDGRGRFRARVAVDGVRRTSDAVLVRVEPDGREVPLNDGKVSTYDAAVAEIFPPRDVLMASAVAAQNRAGSFVTLDRRGRKDLFARLLGLEQMEAMAQTARSAVAILEPARATLVGRRDVLAEAGSSAAVAAVEQAIQAAEAADTANTEREGGLRHLVETREGERATLVDAATRHGAAKARLAALAEQSLETLRRQSAVTRRQQDAERQAQAERQAADTVLRQTHAAADERIGNNRQHVIGRAEAIRAAVATVARVRAEKAPVDEQIAALSTRQDDARRALDGLVEPLQRARAEVTDLERAAEDAATLGTVPCGGAGDFAACSFLSRAQAAATRAARLPEARDALAALETRRADLAAGSEAMGVEMSALRATADRLARELAGAEKDASLAEALKHAEDRIAELEADKVRAAEVHAATVTAIETRLAEVVAGVQAETRDFNAEIDRQGAEVASAEVEVDETADAADKLAACDVSIAEARRGLDAVVAERGRLAGELAGLRARRDQVARDAAELARVHEAIRTLEAELLEWQLIAKALGRDGLPVLEIDHAGPTVSAYANDLMSACAGPRFTVDLVTQVAKASGKGLKEAFDLHVYDNLRGGEARDIADLSGGEQILVDEALKNALALFVNARNVSPIQTCWRDETTGPLDAENATRYLDMVRRVAAIGGFHQVLYVTHNRDAANRADARVRVSDGTLTIERPPYREAA